MMPPRPAEAQWLFTEEQLAYTPSRADGIDLGAELALRKEAIMYMCSLWSRVRGKDVGNSETAAKGVLTTAATLCHRFYMRRSFSDFSTKLISPTILFLASKIEEEPLRLRAIVNCTLDKFEPGAQHWDPKPDSENIVPLEYKRWERDVLATEEVVLEALCFDMGVQQPWTVFRRAINGFDDLLVRRDPLQTSEHPSTVQVTVSANEATVRLLGWTLLSEIRNTPLSILHRAPIIAFAAFVLAVAIIERASVSDELSAACEIAELFGLSISPEALAASSDLASVKTCIRQMLQWTGDGLIDPAVAQLIVPDPPEPRRYRRYQAKAGNGNGLAGSETPMDSAASSSVYTPRRLDIDSAHGSGARGGDLMTPASVAGTPTPLA